MAARIDETGNPVTAFVARDRAHHRRPWRRNARCVGTAATSRADGLLVAAGRGDVEAFGEFYDETAPSVFELVQAALGGRVEDSAAVTEAVYVHTWRISSRFDPSDGSWCALLLRTIRRELIRHRDGRPTSASAPGTHFLTVSP